MIDRLGVGIDGVDDCDGEFVRKSNTPIYFHFNL